MVYVDSNTQMLNSGTIGIGSVMRFNGLVFNDNGTLRMDCTRERRRGGVERTQNRFPAGMTNKKYKDRDSGLRLRSGQNDERILLAERFVRLR